jgi:two-component system, OmpR family, sensor histidine kinase BaeS
MEPPSPSARMPETRAAATAPPQAYQSPPPSSPAVRVPREPWLPVVARADPRLVVGAAAGGISLDIAARAGLSTLAGTCCVLVAVGALLLSRRLRGRAGLLVVAAAGGFGLLLMLRASPWVIAPVTAAIVVMLLLGASLGADRAGAATTFPAIGSRLATAVGHIAAAPGMLAVRPGSGSGRRVLAAGRGVLISAPLLLLVGWLLARANPVFRSWFDLAAVAQHALLVLTGGWAVLGLCRAASAARPVRRLPPGPVLGTVEACVILGGLAAVYAAFTAAQLEALSGAGHRILVTRGLTYAQYARSGFFQLLACAAITLLALLVVRACTRADHPALTALSAATIALTLGVVVSAIRRLQLYEAAFGLTMLRLACLAAACWIAAIFLLLSATLFKHGLPRQHFPAAMVISALVAVAVWGIGNPAAVVARTDLGRAYDGKPLDIGQLVGLGPDAVPTLAATLPRLAKADVTGLRQALCNHRPARASGAALNLSVRSAETALARLCRPPALRTAPRT